MDLIAKTNCRRKKENTGPHEHVRSRNGTHLYRSSEWTSNRIGRPSLRVVAFVLFICSYTYPQADDRSLYFAIARSRANASQISIPCFDRLPEVNQKFDELAGKTDRLSEKTKSTQDDQASQLKRVEDDVAKRATIDNLSRATTKLDALDNVLLK